MIVLVHNAPATLAPYKSKHLGVLSSPDRFYPDVEGWKWAADNGAFSGFKPDKFRRMLDALYGLPGCLFVTSPDVVGDATRTLELFEEWYDELVAAWLPLALVAQDGLTPDQVPWQRIDSLFIGGSDGFKMGEDAAQLVAQARVRDKWVHMGRVNGHQRMRYAKAIRCDSMDGTSLSWFRDTYLPEFLNHASQPPQMLIGHE